MASASEMLDRYRDLHDDTRPNGLLRLNERYRQMVVDAQWNQKEGSIGTTVAGTAEYVILTSVIDDIRDVYVGTAPDLGQRYYPVSMEDLSAIEAGDVGEPGVPVFAEQYNAVGGVYIRLWPTPDVGGLTITGVTSGSPTALTDSTGSTPAIPLDLHRHLFAGLNSDGYLYVSERPDMAQVFEQIFEDGVKRLKARKNSRFGSGPRAMGVSVGGW